jgi:hypothetical protein
VLRAGVPSVVADLVNPFAESPGPGRIRHVSWQLRVPSLGRAIAVLAAKLAAELSGIAKSVFVGDRLDQSVIGYVCDRAVAGRKTAFSNEICNAAVFFEEIVDL